MPIKFSILICRRKMFIFIIWILEMPHRFVMARSGCFNFKIGSMLAFCRPFNGYTGFPLSRVVTRPAYVVLCHLAYCCFFLLLLISHQLVYIQQTFIHWRLRFSNTIRRDFVCNDSWIKFKSLFLFYFF